MGFLWVSYRFPIGSYRVRAWPGEASRAGGAAGLLCRAGGALGIEASTLGEPSNEVGQARTESRWANPYSESLGEPVLSLHARSALRLLGTSKVPAWHVLPSRPLPPPLVQWPATFTVAPSTCTVACHFDSGPLHFHSGPLPRHFATSVAPPTHDTTASAPSARRGRHLPQDRARSKKHVKSCHAKPCYAKPCHAKPCMSCKNHAKSCHAKTMQNHVMQNHAKSCHAKSCHASKCHAKSHQANIMHKPCKIMPCQNHAKSCKTS